MPGAQTPLLAHQRDIQDLRRAYWENEEIAAGGRKILVVEGDDDRKVVEALLLRQRGDATWVNKVHIVAAGGRAHVLRQLERRPGWYGLVDRDTWSPGVAQQHVQRHPKLTVTSGWCLESHLSVPSVLGLIFGGRATPIAQAIEGEVAGWVARTAFFAVLQGCRSDIEGVVREIDHLHEDLWSLDRVPGGALEPHLAQQLAQLPRVTTLDKERVAELLEVWCAEAAELPLEERILRRIHGKHFFRVVVAPCLSRFNGPVPADDWRTRLAHACPNQSWPAELQQLSSTLLA